MTALALAPEPSVGERDEVTAALLAAITPQFTATIGYDPAVGIAVFPQEHPLLGWKICQVPDCGKQRTLVSGMCMTCHYRWKRAGRPDPAVFIIQPKRYTRIVGVRRCRVLTCERPWKSKRSQLCLAHDVQRRDMGIALAEFCSHPAVKPHPSLGPCRVANCTRERAGRGSYCLAHYEHWRQTRAADPAIDEEHWQATGAPSLAEDNRVNLRALPPRVVAEFLYGLQQRCSDNVKTKHNTLRPLLDLARRTEVGSLGDLDTSPLSLNTQKLVNELMRHVKRLFLTPESQRHLDVWDLAAFGFPGNLRFTEISQPWLREATKAWAFDSLPTRRGTFVSGVLQGRLVAIARLSESLRLQRADRGDDPRALGRDDITAFCNRLAYLEGQGQISAYTRSRDCYAARLLLGRFRALGLTRPGRALHGLPEDFTLTREDMPDDPDDREADRDLPKEVIRQVCAHLDRLSGGPSDTEVRAGIQLLVDTGRRPIEIASLPWDCLSTDTDGKPVLVYDNHKANRLSRRLPIAAATAAVVTDQQQRVRERFPDTPLARLKLLPSPVRNPDGDRSISAETISSRHRNYVRSLPELLVPTLVEVEGKPVTRMLPFDKSRVFLYAYRHTYAQRHADAGIGVDVLRQLMDHVEMGTTQQYYRVGEERRREAVDRVAAMQFDRHGNRIWRDAKTLLDSEHVRRAIGEVAVPYGVCTEPSNVAADGQDCPIRFRCVGCGHFRTDISYLPDLETYLADLLRNRERLAAALDADDWAKREAMPSDEEIRRVRRLISRVKAGLDDLSAEERAQIQDAVATVRRARSSVVALGLPRVRQTLIDMREDRRA